MIITVKLTKPWTPEIFMECYCDARNKPIRCKITKPQTASAISLWFWGLLAYPELYCDWPLHNQHSWNFSGVHGFLSLTVTLKPDNKILNNTNWQQWSTPTNSAVWPLPYACAQPYHPFNIFFYYQRKQELKTKDGRDLLKQLRLW